MMTNTWSRPGGWLDALLLGAMLGGCGGAAGKDADSAADDAHLTRRDTTIVHEPCDVEAADAERIDANGDGAADVTIVRAGGVEACRAFDLNFDGVIDAWVYRDTMGVIRRRESDFDRDGRVDEISIFRGGMLSEKQRATTLDGRLDTWQYYQAGRLARTERDANGDAVIDQWWEFPNADKPECPLIHSDVNGDGRPDPGVSVDVCAEQAAFVAPIESGEPKPFDFEGPAGSLPEEVEEKPMGSGVEGATAPAQSPKAGEPGP
jgi:hypothetical protein